ncbi:hypothetical protein BO82DRAFT_356654 [Aspergillus uvarum CBS 121591]|uniref:Transcription factor domain-containing protein n=1 Tax=Aspergillus uvarum CBS 121591 TaxID=1448315 RepID=A0A319C2F9_9EURO|nr:hypothetical protein BO82DRAFT_356654 [Aspergillus uvarum CBS 121591]PYH79285.1 hypothetical protein BO82DRAFT_356654 [Aspergillus uvarum CBS 121591]
MEGSMSEYPLHLEAFKQMNYMSTAANNVHPTSRLRLFLQTAFYLQSTLSDTTLNTQTGIPWPSNDSGYSKEFTETSNLNCAIDDHVLQHTYGITHRLVVGVRSITILFWHRLYYENQSQALPAELVGVISTIRKHVRAWDVTMEQDLLSFDEKSEGGLMKQVRDLHLCAFHHAIQIYLLTHLPQTSCESILPASEDVQFHVDQVAASLLQIEKLKYESRLLSGQRTASIMWPGFIAACESSPNSRKIWCRWWSHMLDYNIGNIELLWQTVQDIWHFSDEVESTKRIPHNIPLWRVFLAQAERTILPL